MSWKGIERDAPKRCNVWVTQPFPHYDFRAKQLRICQLTTAKSKAEQTRYLFNLFPIATDGDPKLFDTNVLSEGPLMCVTRTFVRGRVTRNQQHLNQFIGCWEDTLRVAYRL